MHRIKDPACLVKGVAMGFHEKGAQRVVRKECWVSLVFVTLVLLFLNLMRDDRYWNTTLTFRIVENSREYLNCARLYIAIFCFSLTFPSKFNF